MVLFGRTPCLLVMAMRPWMRMTSGPVVSIASSSCWVVLTVMVGPPAPPVVVARPRALTLAKPIGRVSEVEEDEPPLHLLVSDYDRGLPA